jgi:hypothetical protein
MGIVVPSVNPREGPCRHEKLIGHLHRLDGIDGEHVEACTLVNKRLGDTDVVHHGCAHQRHATHGPRGGRVVAGIKSDRILRPLEGPSIFHAREHTVDLAMELLEVAVHLGA